ncbi:MAG TPA: superoxide dismutase [Kiloniellales bacterium]|nr:superoxide dismutase [Kiloniellales bacterium]
MSFSLPDLPFAYDALAPHMSKATLEFHHDKHHKTYVDKLNAAIDGTRYADMALEDIIRESARNPEERGVFNNAAQHWNHAFFWNCLSPDGGSRPEGELAKRIDADFGGYDAFAKAFKDAAVGQFGSGWAWLVQDNGKLAVTATPNAEPPMIHDQHALLTCDVWEHAYYLDYQNRRPDFVEAVLKELVNWDFVAERLDQGREDFEAVGKVAAGGRR